MIARRKLLIGAGGALAAPLVRAFVTAPEALGGSGALLVELLHR